MGKVVVGVVFESNPKVYYFDPKDIEFKVADKVIVETARGIECGTISFGNKVIPDDSFSGEIKSVIRLATEEDILKHEENLAEKPKVLKSTVAHARKHNLQMKIVGAEYTFDKSKLIICFTAKGRVDFRDLVRDLATEFRTRIELRQIYERDSVKIYGALAPCGMECCCARFLRDYEKTTIKMAKNQDLSLNPSAISGFCGKLMCCLKFENEHYEEVSKKIPRINSIVNTPMGRGKVVGTATLLEKVRVRFFSDDEDTPAKEHEFDVDEITQVRDYNRDRADNRNLARDDVSKEDSKEKSGNKPMKGDGSKDANSNNAKNRKYSKEDRGEHANSNKAKYNKPMKGEASKDVNAQNAKYRKQSKEDRG